MGLGHLAIVFAANYLIAASVVAFAINWNSPQWLLAVGAALLGVLVSVGLAAILALIVYEPRPFVAQHFTPLIQHAADSGFPSDHLSALGAITAGSWFGRRSAGIFAACTSALVGAARVAAGVHYLIDVVAGFVIGAACAVIMWRLLGRAGKQLARLDRWLSLLHLRPEPAAAT